jgi:hypothetical protein
MVGIKELINGCQSLRRPRCLIIVLRIRYEIPIIIPRNIFKYFPPDFSCKNPKGTAKSNITSGIIG